MRYSILLFLIIVSVGISDFEASAQSSSVNKAFLTGETRRIPADMFGYNGKTSKGPSYSDSNFQDLLERMKPGIIRYPAGTYGNYFNWRTGLAMGSKGLNKVPYTISEFVGGIPDVTSIIYMVNMARPTPATGVSMDASAEVLASQETFELKQEDILEAIAEFEKQGHLPEYIELGSEFYFTNEHASVYGGNPSLYLDHAKQLAIAIKNLYHDIKICLIATKGGANYRNKWNDAIFNALETDEELADCISAVTQHHYISDSFGLGIDLSGLETAKQTISDAFDYTANEQSSYDDVPAAFELWITEYGATKTNTLSTWASSIRAVAMTFGFMDMGEKIKMFTIQHLTHEETIDLKNYSLNGIGVSMTLLLSAAKNKTNAQKLDFTNNPVFYGQYKSLHGWKFCKGGEESIVIINCGETKFSDIDITKVFGSPDNSKEYIQYSSESPWEVNVSEIDGLTKSEGDVIEKITIPGFSVTHIFTNSGTVLGNVEPIKKMEVLVYPNPTSGLIKVSNLGVGNTEIQVFDQLGRQIVSKRAMSQVEDIDLRAFCEGVYFVYIRIGDNVKTLKVIKNS